LAGWPVVAVEQLAFQGGEEALGDGVVECVADGAHGGDQRDDPLNLGRQPWSL
jgi:hypothetical protein